MKQENVGALKTTIATSTVAGAVPPSGGVLVIDDEAIVRTVLRRVLLKLGYQAESVESGLEAITAVARDPSRFVAALLDVSMPGIVTEDVIDGVRSLAPTLPLVIMSGWDPETIRQRFGSRPSIGFLPKPFDAASLVRAFNDIRL